MSEIIKALEAYQEETGNEGFFADYSEPTEQYGSDMYI